MDDWPDLLAAVTADDVKAAAQKLVASTATVNGWLLPAEAPAASAPTPTPES